MPPMHGFPVTVQIDERDAGRLQAGHINVAEISWALESRNICVDVR